MDLRHLRGLDVLPASCPLPLDRPFTLRTARVEAGLSRGQMAWLVDRGYLRRPIQGVYVNARLPDSIALRCACLRLVAPADAVLVDRHAGWAHGATMVLAPNEHLEVAPVTYFLPGGEGRRLRNPLVDSGERTLQERDVTELHGLRVTTPIRTAWDLGRTRWTDRSLAALDQMLRLGAFSKQELVQGVGRFRGMRWVTVLRLMAPLADGRAESPGESVLRLRWIQAGLATPIPQHELWVGGDFVARFDLADPELRHAAEYDGEEWHSTPDRVAHDQRRRSRAEDEAGWLVQAFGKENVFGPRHDAEALLRAGAAQARSRTSAA